jgi:hypothetical protein
MHRMEAQATQRHISRKSMTDPFQVFCAENRPEIAGLNPNESVGTITSMLASIWRSMGAEKRTPYLEFAEQFNRSQQALIKPPRPAPVKEPKVSLILPSIYVVKRIGCSGLIHETSICCLTQSMDRQPFDYPESRIACE